MNEATKQYSAMGPDYCRILRWGRSYLGSVDTVNPRSVVVFYRTKGDEKRGAPYRRVRVHWTSLRVTAAQLDRITQRCACRTFDELVKAEGGYRPTIHPRDAWDHLLIAAYNTAQRLRGDDRRTYPDNGATELNHYQLETMLGRYQIAREDA